MKKILLVAMLFYQTFALADFVPNYVFILNEKNVKSDKSQQNLQSSIQLIQEYYNRHLPANKRQLHFKVEWENPRISAFATLDDQDDYLISISGGLINHQKMNREILTLILCHELGHFYGGLPKKRRGNSNLYSWASSEGQADYFATSKCLRTIFEEQISNIDSKIQLNLDDNDRKQIQYQCGNSKICEHISAISLQTTRIYAEVKFESTPKLEYKDPVEVWETMDQHPNSQCRLDTLVAGLKCPISSQIPFSDQDLKLGACQHQGNTKEYARPRCWYKP